MSGFNQVILLGRLGSDPELKYTQGGTAVVSLSIATSRRQKKRNSDDWEEITSWHRVKAFGKQAEVIAEYASKGDQLFIEGRLEYWEAKSDRGAKLMIAEIVLEHFDFAGGKRQGGDEAARGGGGGARSTRGASSRPTAGPRGATRGPSGRQPEQPPADDFSDDDIPF